MARGAGESGPPSGTGDLSELRRRRGRVTGVVQGVGFRPFVYRLAAELELAGWVLNDSEGVLLEVEGPPGSVERFFERLLAEAPPLAGIEDVRTQDRPVEHAAAFEIHESDDSSAPSALVSPDTATCDDCLDELFDPDDRRYRYPFINCTNCGPRFTIVRGVPYDRPLTTMAGFEMCEPCRHEYEDPTDRRFHAQPNACPDCGPTVRLVDGAGELPSPGSSTDPLEAAGVALLDGAVLAVKGLGGYHLACVAADEDAVSRLRSRKHREDKPFALMAADLDGARALVRLAPEEETLLRGRERPIVLALRRHGAAVAPSVAPGHRDLGVMLPYSPLHHLLLEEVGEPLVMTSGNVSDEPIVYRDDEALERLAPVADLFLLHDRPIETRTDDSVVRVLSLPDGPATQQLRRSRGYVPSPLGLPVPGPPLVACGAHLKNTFTVSRGGRAWVGHHIGDLESYETLRSFREGIDHFEELFAVEPELAVHDLHPDYLSTRYATEREGLPTVAVQHHHAHLAACLAEHGVAGPAVGAIFDGTGYGPDGTVWGGEILVGDLLDFERAGSLRPTRLPGGEAAIREPWRMACAWICEVVEDGIPEIPEPLAGAVEADAWKMLVRMARRGIASPMTTSVGRLFDAVAALCGLRARVTYEGQAAIELEMAASRSSDDRGYPLSWAPVTSPPGSGPEGDPGRGEWEAPLRLDPVPTIRAVLDDLEGGTPVEVVASRFHRGLAEATARVSTEVARERGLDVVVLSGGVFQNLLLLERTASLLDGEGLRVLVPERLPPNDGGISYGQAAVAAARSRG